MEEYSRNPRKKYPIIPTQILTGRDKCAYCRRSSEREPKPDNTEMCSNCGFGSKELMTGLLLSVFDKLEVPMVLIERVNCECISKNDIPPAGYHVHNGETYHLVNLVSFKSSVIVDSPCYTSRRDKTHGCWLEDFCNEQDTSKGDRVFSAIYNDEEGVIVIDPVTKIEYYSYTCRLSKLTEIVIPIYANETPQKRSERGVVGLLLIGQVAVGKAPEAVEDSEIVWPEDKKEWISQLRKNVWEKAEKENKIYSSVAEVLKKHCEHLRLYLEEMRDEIKARETDYLHIYQSKLFNDFLHKEENEDEKIRDAVSLKSRILKPLKKVWQDFDLKELHVVIPDLELKVTVKSLVITGENVGNTLNKKAIEIDIGKLTKPSSYEVDVAQLVEKEGIHFLVENPGPAARVSLDTAKVNKGYYELYLADYNGSSKTDKIMFGIFIEWNTLPSSHDNTYSAHKDFFRALVGVCASEVMAYLASRRAERLASFAEETRHDLAHRLQILASHNTSFRLTTKNYYNFKLYPAERYHIPIHMYVTYTYNYIDANEELFETLEFMKDELDSENIYREVKHEQVHAFIDVLATLNHQFNAAWHPRNMGHKLEVSETEWFTDRLYADKIMFRRIVTNLLDNAFKYSPPGTRIYIEQKYDHNTKELIFDVVNFSYGIKEQDATRIFEHGGKVFRATEGKGLGLYIARDFAERNGGSLTLESGVIPNDGNENTKKEKGLVSGSNFTLYYDVLEWKERYPKRSKLDDLLEKLRLEREQLKTQGDLLRDLGKKFSKPFPLATVMVEYGDEKPARRAGDTLPSAGDLLTFGKHEVYKTVFRLRLPSIDKAGTIQ